VGRDKYKFNLEEGEQCVWRRIIGSIPTAWVAKLTDPSREVKSGDWLSIYYNDANFKDLQMAFCANF